ncbi:MAG: class I SAM-dependent methyltransferase [Candidatus Accumulibacter sp.]|jgi:ubiquinone/menaquinone biosynthesis C-methylase UbiE|nr:class I SAM-dependent methyltransferase [Accumulibacter sp.]
MDFAQISYSKHADSFEEFLVNPDKINISLSWFDENSADCWRHLRMYECAAHLQDNPDLSWLTVGDGRWGLDAIRIKKKGFRTVLPTDISGFLLKTSKERGFIDNYAVENCEKLTFQDNSFDYVFCKESFHHFPRPYLALYEMLRVAKLGVFLIEPSDRLYNNGNISPSFVSIFRNVLRYALRLIRTRIRQDRVARDISDDPVFEPVGNYVYTLSRREILKAAYGLALPQIAIKGINDHYIEGCEFEPADTDKSLIFKKIKRRIALLDMLCQAGINDYGMLMCGIFKTSLPDETRRKFQNHGWEVKDIVKNPYLN